MRASVDAEALVVRSGDSAWPFSVDRGGVSATITLDGVAYRVRPQSWREKVRLSRFARLGESFVESSFLECCVAEGGPACAATAHKEALLALALWINLPGDDTAGLPLDADQLARVTIEVCRSMNIGPLAIADLSAPEVESLWRNLDRATIPNDENHWPRAEETFDTKIVVLADAANFNEAGQAVSRSGTALPPRHEIESPPSEAKRDDPAEADAHAAPAAHKEEHVTEARSQEANAGEPAPSGARFRVLFTTAADERRVATARSRAGSWQRSPATPIAAYREAKPLPMNAEQESPKSGAGRNAEISGHATAVAVAERENLPPAAATEAARTAVPVLHTAAPGVATPDIAPSIDFARQPASMESLLDEFCERLEEAAADLGILEEV